MLPQLYCLLFCASLCLGTQLIHVQTVWRHGDRAPMKTFPTDSNKEDAWPVKWGDITKEGMLQLFHQGLKFKERYIDELKFLSPNYFSGQVYIQSTDTDRTLISAYAHLAGIYSESQYTYPSEFRWPKKWTPVPVHTVKYSQDLLLFPWLLPCDRRWQLAAEQYVVPEYKKFLKDQKAFLDELTRNTGWNAHDFSTLFYLADVLFIERLHNLTFPDWLTKEAYNKIQKVTFDQWDYLFGKEGFGEPEHVELVALNGGFLLGKLIDNMIEAKEGQSGLKFHGFSAHDTSLSTLLLTLGAKDALVGDGAPQYGSILVLELWKTGENEFSVRLLWSGNPSSPLKTATRAIQGCPNEEFCPLEVFLERSRKYAIKEGDVAEACKATK